MPKDLVDSSRHLHEMILLLFPTMATKSNHQKRWDASFAQSLPQIKVLFWKIFKENNIQMRKKFFQEPLIRHLWSMFIEQKPTDIVEYLDELKKEPGQEKYKAIVKDIHDLGYIVDFKIFF